MANSYQSLFHFYKACIHAHVCGTALLATQQYVVLDNGNVVVNN